MVTNGRQLLDDQHGCAAFSSRVADVFCLNEITTKELA
jgi:hypothetical protein